VAHASIPITIVLILGHHNASNVAAGRYRGLLPHLNVDLVRTVVITRDGPLASERGGASLVRVVPGEVFSSKVGKRYLLSLIVQLIRPAFSRLGYLIAPDSWALGAARTAREVILCERARGRSVVVLGSFCPLDAIVAATCAATAERVPLLLDFRDGLGFESIGSNGWLAIAIKRRLEARMCRRASRVFTVSSPLVTYLRGRYPGLPVDLLRNGYDPVVEFALGHRSYAAMQAFRQRRVRCDVCLIGYFGRISSSDPGARDALQALVDWLRNTKPELRERLHFLFMGELTLEDLALIKRIECDATVLRQRPRMQAINAMRCCDALLLLSSNRRSVATGKLFDYLAVGKKILQVTMARNEASSLLKDSGIAHLTIDATKEAAGDSGWQQFLSMAPRATRHPEDYSMRAQARLFQESLLHVVAGR
jgi:glycosyltransferase involved in cell wall biosynthesis